MSGFAAALPDLHAIMIFIDEYCIMKLGEQNGEKRKTL